MSIKYPIKCYTILRVMIHETVKKKISITIDSDLLEKLREKADEDCRPLSQYINLVLRKHVEQEEKKQK